MQQLYRGHVQELRCLTRVVQVQGSRDAVSSKSWSSTGPAEFRAEVHPKFATSARRKPAAAADIFETRLSHEGRLAHSRGPGPNAAPGSCRRHCQRISGERRAGPTTEPRAGVQGHEQPRSYSSMHPLQLQTGADGSTQEVAAGTQLTQDKLTECITLGVSPRER